MKICCVQARRAAAAALEGEARAEREAEGARAGEVVDAREAGMAAEREGRAEQGADEEVQ